jgi:SPP1 gp7 family putative phage head morphogenesis protein
MQPPIKPPDLLNLILNQDKQLTKQDLEYLNRIIMTYGGMYRKLLPYIRNIELLIASGMSQYQLRRSDEYRNLLDVTEKEVKDYSTWLKIEMGAATFAAIGLASSHFVQLIGKDVEVISTDAIQNLRNYLADGGELMKKIEFLAPQSVLDVKNVIIDGVKLGKNPRVIAREIQKAFGTSLTDSMRMTRTVQLYSYREATRANYIVNSDIVKGWIWYAHLDDRTCASCINMHGTLHELSEILNGHHNDRCVMLPYPQCANVIKQSGEEWLKAQPKEKQIGILGKGKYEAWINNKFEFAQLTREYSDDVYGIMRGETPLKELI